MIYLKRFNEDFDCEKCEDMSPEEREETDITSYSEDNVDSIISKIKEKYPEANYKSDLVEMICWYEDQFCRINKLDEDEIIHQLSSNPKVAVGIEYGL